MLAPFVIFLFILLFGRRELGWRPSAFLVVGMTAMLYLTLVGHLPVWVTVGVVGFADALLFLLITRCDFWVR